MQRKIPVEIYFDEDPFKKRETSLKTGWTIAVLVFFVIGIFIGNNLLNTDVEIVQKDSSIAQTDLINDQE